jgi:glutamyl-tRNA reductase
MDTLVVVTWRTPTATAQVLEQVTVTRDARAHLHPSALGLAGFVVLNTCQRVLWALEGTAADAEKVVSWYARSGSSLPTPEVLDGFDAFRHLAEVASSLDSLVPGEPQVLGQVKEALREAEARHTVTPSLRHVFDHVLRTAKAVRSSSGLFRGRVSLLPLVEHAMLPVLANLEVPRIAVVGTGEMAGRVRRMLRRSRRDAVLLVVSRDAARARAVAQASGCEGVELQRFLSEPPHVHAIITAVESERPVVAQADLERFRLPVTVVDLGMPRNVQRPEVPVPGLHLVQLDELVAMRDSTLDQVRHEFELRCQASDLRLLAHRFEQVARERWQRAGIAPADPKLQKWYDQTVRALLHEATTVLKEKGAR